MYFTYQKTKRIAIIKAIASCTLWKYFFNLLEWLFHKPKRKCISKCNFTFQKKKKGGIWILHLPMCIMHLPLLSNNTNIFNEIFTSYLPTLTPPSSLLSTHEDISLDSTPSWWHPFFNSTPMATTPVPLVATPPPPFLISWR